MESLLLLTGSITIALGGIFLLAERIIRARFSVAREYLTDWCASLVTAPAWPALVDAEPTPLANILHWAGFKKIPKLKAIAGVALILLLPLGLILGARGFLFGLVGLGLGAFLILRAAAKRKKMFVAELPEALRALADALRSGFTMPQALAWLARELTEPLGSAFRTLVRAEELRLPVGEAASVISRQLKIPEWELVAEMLGAQQNIGGNFIPLLTELGQALHDARAAQDELKSLTAAGRTSGILVAALMPATLIMFSFLSPSYTETLFGTAAGRLAFGVAVLLEIIGAGWIYFLVRSEY